MGTSDLFAPSRWQLVAKMEALLRKNAKPSKIAEPGQGLLKRINDHSNNQELLQLIFFILSRDQNTHILTTLLSRDSTRHAHLFSH